MSASLITLRIEASVFFSEADDQRKEPASNVPEVKNLDLVVKTLCDSRLAVINVFTNTLYI